MAQRTRWYHLVLGSPWFLLFGFIGTIRRMACRARKHRVSRDNYCNRCHEYLTAPRR